MKEHFGYNFMANLQSDPSCSVINDLTRVWHMQQVHMWLPVNHRGDWSLRHSVTVAKRMWISENMPATVLSDKCNEMQGAFILVLPVTGSVYLHIS